MSFFSFFFYKIREQRAEQGGGRYQWGDDGERGLEGEYGAKKVYTCM
jgi:hypothetical protein